MRKYVASHGLSSRVSSQSDWHSLSAGRPHTAGMSALPEEGAPIACVVSACTLRLRTKPKNGFSGASKKTSGPLYLHTKHTILLVVYL